MSNIYYAKRGNKILRISEETFEKYVSQGYTITDSNGAIIEKGTPRDTNLLTAEVKGQQAEIENLVNENKGLKAELDKVKAELEQANKELIQVKAELDKFKSMPISEPRTTRKRKQTTETEE